MHRFAGGPLATRACDRVMLAVSLPRVELGRPSFGRSAADSAAREVRAAARAAASVGEAGVEPAQPKRPVYSQVFSPHDQLARGVPDG